MTLPGAGVLVIDKPRGPTSFDMVARVRRAAGQRRAGHAGTLDPMATGVLLICLGEATKLVPFLMDADKEYRATALLGVTTDTDDADEGARVIARADQAAVAALDPERVRAALLSFVGSHRQRPPRYSALKVAGRRLHELARGGGSDEALEAHIADKEREVLIHDITIEEIALPSLRPEGEASRREPGMPGVSFTVRCGKGTYIRSLARDLGERLGVGGHLIALRRLGVGRFTVADATSLDADEEGRARFPAAPRLFSMTQALGHLPALALPADEAAAVRNGQRWVLAQLSERLPDLPAGHHAAVLDEAGDLAAVIVRNEGNITIARGFARSS